MSAAAEAVPERPWVLRPYQIAALRGISTAWNEHQRTLLVLATGLGKTTVCVEVALRRKAAGRGRTLMVAHRIELVRQLAERAELGGLSVEVESGDSLASPLGTLQGASDVVVATVQTLKGRRLDRWGPRSFGTIVIDEAHHATAASYRTVLDHFPEAKVLGLTATPDRGDKIAIGHVIPSLAFAYGIREGIADGFLARLRIIPIDWPSMDLSTIAVRRQEHGRDFSPEQLAKQARREQSIHEVAVPITLERGDRQTLSFHPSVEVAHEVARVMAAHMDANRVSSLDGTSNAEDRREVLRRYLCGDVHALANCALFTEGFDAPSTACVAIGRPTQSRSLYAQMIGRGTRLAPGKTDCIVLDFAPANARHSLVSPVDLFVGDDLDPDERQRMTRDAMTGEDVMKVVERGEAQAKLREEERQRERERSNIRAEVRYQKRERDPFEEFDLPTVEGDARGPRATEKQAAALNEILGMTTAGSLSRRQASVLMDEHVKRRSANLPSFKQCRLLAEKGLRTDLTRTEAGEAMTLLKANRWKMTSEIAERFGT